MLPEFQKILLKFLDIFTQNVDQKLYLSFFTIIGNID